MKQCAISLSRPRKPTLPERPLAPKANKKSWKQRNKKRDRVWFSK